MFRYLWDFHFLTLLHFLVKLSSENSSWWLSQNVHLYYLLLGTICLPVSLDLTVPPLVWQLFVLVYLLQVEVCIAVDGIRRFVWKENMISNVTVEFDFISIASPVFSSPQRIRWGLLRLTDLSDVCLSDVWCLSDVCLMSDVCGFSRSLNLRSERFGRQISLECSGMI